MAAMTPLLSEINGILTHAEAQPDFSDFDSLRNKHRVEIIAAFLMSYYHCQPQSPRIAELESQLLRQQTLTGAWLEKSYEPTEPDVGYDGAVPTCFAVLALSCAPRSRPDAITGMVRGADYLYSIEKGGCFFKAKINRTDVLNTNLLAAVTLMRVADKLPEKSRRIELYRAAARRAVIHVCSSQRYGGAFPYKHHGWRVSFLYHAMTLALLDMLARYMPLSRSVEVTRFWAADYLRSIWAGADFRWAWESCQDKQGASWTYAWAISSWALTEDPQLENAVATLRSLRKGYYKNVRSEPFVPDLFYTAWSLLALNLTVIFQRQPRAKYRLSVLRWWRLGIAHGRRLLMVMTYFRNRFLLAWDYLDRGPIEYW